jgi:2'-5' RNA ligase
MSAVGDSALAFFLPQAEADVVNRWRLRYDPHVQSIAPHITVTYPPFIPPQEWLLVRSEMIACLAGFPPFEVTVQSTGMFNDSPRVLWLGPEDDGHFARIHFTLTERFPQYVPLSLLEYIPHVTIGFFDDPESLTHAQHTVMQELKPLHFRVNELSLGVLDANMKWQLEDRLLLGRIS